MKQILTFILVAISVQLANANTTVDCLAKENSVFYGVSFELDSEGQLLNACSSTGGYGCLELKCKKINHLDYECARSYKRKDSGQIISHVAFIIINRNLENTLVVRSIKEDSVVKVDVEKLEFCKVR